MATAIEELTGGALAPSQLSDPGLFVITELSPPKRRAARSFTGSFFTTPVIVAGGGGWSRVARPRKRALTEWVGRDSISISFDFLIDEFSTMRGKYVERQCRNLDRMAGVGIGDAEPPLCMIESHPQRLIPYGEKWAPGYRWFIESLVWAADRTIVNQAGNRVRAGGTIIITQFIVDKRLSLAKRRKDSKGRGSRGGRRKTYVVRPGDTLHSIAARKDVYGDASKWTRISKANNIRSREALKKRIGKTIKIP